MANVFRQFYEELYASQETLKSTDKATPKTGNQVKLLRVTIKEVDKALKELKNGKCKDTKYVTAEIIKHAGIKTRKLIADICSDGIRGGDIQESSTITQLMYYNIISCNAR